VRPTAEALSTAVSELTPRVRALLVIALVALVIAVPVTWAIKIHNQLVVLDQEANQLAAEIQNGYQRRADLIPNLVETVKGFATQEKSVLEGVTRARASATSTTLTRDALDDPQAVGGYQAAQDQLSGALGRMMVTVERYPKLTSNKNFMALEKQLTKTEDRIARDREYYNRAVKKYNTRLYLFPGSMVARALGFKPKSYFVPAGSVAEPPDVKF
jgi:LemA protein